MLRLRHHLTVAVLMWRRRLWTRRLLLLLLLLRGHNNRRSVIVVVVRQGWRSVSHQLTTLPWPALSGHNVLVDWHGRCCAATRVVIVDAVRVGIVITICANAMAATRSTATTAIAADAV
uniref:Putative secreted protein n=1 Tax=Anopheles marajoara TaxID=58244 RepID=A0A2M4C7N0_9DIPT